jgi:hypothetical protein
MEFRLDVHYYTPFTALDFNFTMHFGREDYILCAVQNERTSKTYIAVLCGADWRRRLAAIFATHKKRIALQPMDCCTSNLHIKKRKNVIGS